MLKCSVEEKSESDQHYVSNRTFLCGLVKHHLFPDVSFVYKLAWMKMPFQRQGFIMNRRVELCFCPVTKGDCGTQVSICS